MSRLYPKAHKILVAEVVKTASKDPIAGEVSQDLVLKRLDRLRSQKGEPANEAELRELLQDVLPNFSDRVIKQAAKANHPKSKLWLLPKAAVAIAALSGGIWVLNLPYPMIRRPVARTAPILLLPSFISMDRNYRAATAKVEQADQLVNRATSMADLELGQKKVSEAQGHLDKLPVWFIGYEPRVYMNFFRVGFMFTLDEYRAARADIGRMEAVVFQETNAMNELSNAEVAIAEAKENYQKAADETTKQTSLSNWQAGIDRLVELPAQTLAAKQAQTKLKAYSRDFADISGLFVGNDITNKTMGSAKRRANQAQEDCGNQSLSQEQWQNCAQLWEQAISFLGQIPIEDPSYDTADILRVEYERQLSQVRASFTVETKSTKAYNSAKSKIEQLPTEVNDSNKERTIRQIRAILSELEQVKSGTTVEQDARLLIDSAQQKLRQIEKS